MRSPLKGRAHPPDCEHCAANTRHGHLRRRQETPTRTSWRAMIWRCTNPKHREWKYYGGRGITVCDRWRNSFEDFLADVGVRPIGRWDRETGKAIYTTIDRIESDGNYEPGNCRWATPSQQQRNKRRAA